MRYVRTRLRFMDVTMKSMYEHTDDAGGVIVFAVPGDVKWVAVRTEIIDDGGES